jgi:Domain of unknown function (DUF2017)
MMGIFRRPVRRSGSGFVIDLRPEEAALVRRLVGQLRALLTDDRPDAEAQALIVRLFPVAYPDDDEMEAEYQRLMRDELVQSKLAAFDVIDEAVGSGDVIDEGRLVAVMQSINSIRLVLGVILDVSDDPDAEVDEQAQDSPEYHLYGYLSMLLDACVQALSGR